MDMEAQEEFMGSDDLTQMVKGKRTKRQRSSSPRKAAAAVVSSSSSGCGVVEEYGSISSPAASSNDEVYESTEELEEDMANCLILLAQGDRPRHHRRRHLQVDDKKFSARKFYDVSSTTTATKAGFYVYECKTCNRSFPSFQALGGHRASHKKPKSTIEDKKVFMIQPSSMDDHDLDDCQLIYKSNLDHHQHHDSLSLQVSSTNKAFLGNNNKSKIHECSICGSEFTSGQALGGHMRRHRSASNGNNSNNQLISTSTNIDDQIKPRNILPLDLNLPAPEDDHLHRESKFQLVFSAPALVDCHY